MLCKISENIQKPRLTAWFLCNGGYSVKKRVRKHMIQQMILIYSNDKKPLKHSVQAVF